DGDAAMRIGIDIAEPAAPFRRLLAVRRITGQISRHGMAPPGLGDARQEAFLEDIAGWLGRQHAAQRRAVEAQGRAEVRACRLEQRAAFPDIARDVREIGGWQDAAPGIAVEDDEVELVDLDVEQLADREGDERKL